MFLLVTF